MLTDIKRRGRRRVFIKKAVATGTTLIVLILGAFFFQSTESKEPGLFPKNGETRVVAFMNEDAFYDDELGFIYKR
jgi:hypothetical protein